MSKSSKSRVRKYSSKGFTVIRNTKVVQLWKLDYISPMFKRKQNTTSENLKQASFHCFSCT